MIAILGAGMAGFGAAHRLFGEGVGSVMFEQKPYHGGHTATYKYDSGFVFDDGPHISFTKDERIRELFAASVKQEFETIHARVNNYWRGYWIKHPAQCNLHGLPADLVVRAISDLVEAHRRDELVSRNYAEWLVSMYGYTFATMFPMQYGLKYHTTTADNMSVDWIGPRLYRPKLEEVLKGAISAVTEDVHYVSHFRYPTRNGFVSFLDGLLGQTELRLAHRLARLDPRSRLLTFANGLTCSYDSVVSSIPLPELIPLVVGAPSEVVRAAERLACTTAVMVNVGVDRPDLSDAHWTYFYDDDIVFSRLSFPHMLSSRNVPPGAGSIQAEVYFSKKYKPLNQPPESFIDPVIADLRRCGYLRDTDRILFRNTTVSPYANVIFDLDRAEALEIVHGYLDEIGVAYCGRYGEWGYQWTDESFVSGENAAQKVLDRAEAAVSIPSLSS